MVGYEADILIAAEVSKLRENITKPGYMGHHFTQKELEAVRTRTFGTKKGTDLKVSVIVKNKRNREVQVWCCHEPYDHLISLTWMGPHYQKMKLKI